jgi:hypothetical protein
MGEQGSASARALTRLRQDRRATRLVAYLERDLAYLDTFAARCKLASIAKISGR